MPLTPYGDSNGRDLTYTCPGHPDVCKSDTSVLISFREWWYTADVTLTGKCDHWRFSVALPARSNDVVNQTGAGSYNLYNEALLNNLDAGHNSSAQFLTKPIPNICINQPFVFNEGVFDYNSDSLYAEAVQPLGDGSCLASVATVPYSSGYSIANPLPTSSGFSVTNNGVMSFTPTALGIYDLAVRVTEYRNIAGVWKMIGRVTRDVLTIVRPCNTAVPAITVVNSSLTGAAFVAGAVYATATQPLSFDYYAKSVSPTAMITVYDGHSMLSGSNTSYISMYTDSVRGNFSWTPGASDTGWHMFPIVGVDSNCSTGLMPSASTAVPIYIAAIPVGINSNINRHNDISIYPNPNTGSFIVKARVYNAAIQKVTINILNNIGQVVYREQVSLTNGLLDKRLELNNKLPGGIYLLKLQAGEQTYISRFSVQQ